MHMLGIISSAYRTYVIKKKIQQLVDRRNQIIHTIHSPLSYDQDRVEHMMRELNRITALIDRLKIDQYASTIYMR
jgi:tRNA uridine 5-carbamoylmethylation protein Kti12